MIKDEQKKTSKWKKFKDYKLAIKWNYLVPFFSLLLLIPIRSFAVIDKLTSAIAGMIWTVILQPLMYLLNLELGLLKIIAGYNNFTHEAGVTAGWVALRDLSNMFFILILLVIAFATILRISSYGYQQLLKRTLIIAILINFSKTIVGFFIDVVQVVMLTFISAVDDLISGGIVVAVGLQKITQLKTYTDGAQAAFSTYIIALILAIVFLAILVVIVGVMVMMLMMRIVALWVAIVLSPLAFLASIFPVTKSFYDRWVKELGTNLVTGPMLAFFLWLTFSIVSSGNSYTSFGVDATTGEVAPATEFLTIQNMINYVIAIALLLMGIKMAASSGAAGANMAAKGMSGIQGAAGWANRKVKTTGKNIASRTGASLSRGLQDEHGNFKVKAFNKVPLVSNMAKRAGMKMQGYNARRIATQDNLRMKNVLPQHRVAFGESRAGKNKEEEKQKPGWKKKVYEFASGGLYKPNVDEEGNLKARGTKWRSFRKGVSTVVTGGASREAADLSQTAKFQEGKIDTYAKAVEVAKSAKRTGNKAMLDQVHKQFPGTFQTESEITESINKNGIRGSMTALTAEGAEGPGVIKWLDALTKHKNYKEGDLGDHINTLDPKAKIKWGDKLIELDKTRRKEREDDPNKPAGTRIKTGSNDNIAQFNEFGTVALNQEAAHGNLGADIARVYPNKAVSSLNSDVNIVSEELSSGRVVLPDNAIDKLNLNPDNEKDNLKKQSWETGKKKYDKEIKAIDSSKDSEEDKEKAKEKPKEEWGNTKRQLFGAYTEKELDEHIKYTKSEEAKGNISYDEATEEYRETYGNPNANTEKMDQDMINRIGDKAPLAPIQQILPGPSQKQIEDKKQELIKATPFKAGAGFDKDHKQEKADYEAEKEREAKDELTKEKDKEQVELDNQYTKDKAIYTSDATAFADSIKGVLSGINNNSDATKIKELKVSIKDAKTKGDDKLVASLLVQQNKLIRSQNILRREASGVNVSQKNNHAMASVLRNVNDGSSYRRMSEMDVSNPIEANMFKEFAKVASQSQQKQLLDTGSDRHLELFAEAVIEGRGKPNKSLMDNFTKDVKKAMNRKMDINVYIKQGKTLQEARVQVDKDEAEEAKKPKKAKK